MGTPANATIDQDPVVDIDDEPTWTNAIAKAAREETDCLGELSEHTSELNIDPDDGWFRSLFDEHLLLAYHATRLLDAEVESVRAHGLRMLTPALVAERLATAIDEGVLSTVEAEALRAGDVFATRQDRAHRQNRICVFTSRTTLDNSVSGLWRLMSTWGGEAIYSTRNGNAATDRLRSVGRPAVVVVGLDIVGDWRRHLASPGILQSFVGKVLGLSNYGSEIQYKNHIPAARVLNIWQPGAADYDQHERLASAVSDASL